jgi:hypothetical protein
LAATRSRTTRSRTTRSRAATSAATTRTAGRRSAANRGATANVQVGDIFAEVLPGLDGRANRVGDDAADVPCQFSRVRDTTTKDVLQIAPVEDQGAEDRGSRIDRQRQHERRTALVSSVTGSNPGGRTLHVLIVLVD